MPNKKLHLTMMNLKPLSIKGYDIARANMMFTDEDAMQFVSSIHELHDHRFENLVTKEFLGEKMNGINFRFVKFESSIDIRFTKVEYMLNNQIAEAKSDYTKWIFIF
jgi:hypothetical protein